MAVAHDNHSESHTGATGSANEASFTWQHDPVGVPRGVIVFVINMASAGPSNVTGVTYDGVALSTVSGGFAEDTAGESGMCEAWFLGANVPTTDPADIVVSRVNDADEMIAFAATVTAGGDTEVYVPGIVLLQENGTLAEENVDDGSPATDSVRYAAGFSGLAAFPPTGANSTGLHDFDTGQQTAAFVRRTNAGVGSLPVGFASGTADDRAFVHLAIREIAVVIQIPNVMMAPYIAR